MEPESKVIEDLAHQLRGPLSAAIARLNNILQENHLDSSLEKQVRAIRGLCHKANRVAGSARLFSLFSSAEQPIHLRLTKLTSSDLMEMLIECAQDNEILISPQRQIRITVDQNSLNTIREISADPELLQQAVNNLLDNAAKYSFSDTVISITAQHRERMIKIIVTNRGVSIRPQEVSKCVERGWRGREAMLVTGEGSGLGLWVADHIMKAHQGSVLISPTDSSGCTQVQLVFPASKESS